MDKSKKEILESVAGLYFLLAVIDLEFKDAEEKTIEDKLNERIHDITQGEFENIVSSALSSLKSSDHTEFFTKCSETLKTHLDKKELVNVTNDLVAIAFSDGIIHDSERKMIDSLAENWGITDVINIDKYISETKKVRSVSGDSFDLQKKAGNIFHDILSLLIYTGSESKNNLTDLEWKTIYANIAGFNLVIGDKSFNITGHKKEEISETADAVIERMWGSEDNPLDPFTGFQKSVDNIISYYNDGILDETSLYTIIRFMFEVSTVDGFITDSQKNILEGIIETFIPAVPSLQKIKNMTAAQVKKQDQSREVMPEEKPKKGGSIKMVFETGKAPDEPQEILAEVFKEQGNYRARIIDSKKDITEIIDDPAKLKNAYEKSGLVRGKKNKDGGYDWRVIKKRTDK